MGARLKAGFVEGGCKAKRPDLLRVGAMLKAGFLEVGCKAKGQILLRVSEC